MKFKKILAILGIIVLMIVSSVIALYYYFTPNENKVLNFIQNNPDKSAILLVRNDTILASRNIDKVMPLASTVKIILAIEYAIQSAREEVDPNEQILLSDLDKFYVPRTDGGAHKSWMRSVKNKIADNKISIREIAKGMIQFSSNANTEWLLDKLQADKVNQRIVSLGLNNHTEIYPIVSALFVGKELFPGMNGKELENKLQNVSTQDYIEATHRIHQKLLTDTLYKKDLGDLALNIQKIWSDRLPASTVSDYVSIMKKMNSRRFFDEKTQQYLDEVME